MGNVQLSFIIITIIIQDLYSAIESEDTDALKCLSTYLFAFNVFFSLFGLVGNVVYRINKVNQRRVWLVLGWVTVCRRVNHFGM